MCKSVGLYKPAVGGGWGGIQTVCQLAGGGWWGEGEEAGGGGGGGMQSFTDYSG